jgi:hypothetical protein
MVLKGSYTVTMTVPISESDGLEHPSVAWPSTQA